MINCKDISAPKRQNNSEKIMSDKKRGQSWSEKEKRGTNKTNKYFGCILNEYYLLPDIQRHGSCLSK